LLRDAAYQLQPPEARAVLHECALRSMEHVADGRSSMLDHPLPQAKRPMSSHPTPPKTGPVNGR
jgi:hypothetical protein